MQFTPEKKPTDWNPQKGGIPPRTVTKHGEGHGMEKPSAGTSPVSFKGKPDGGGSHSIDSPPYKMPRSHNK
jgi:hypothetical protein